MKRKKLRSKRCPVCITEGIHRDLIPTRLGNALGIYWYCEDCRAYLDYTPIRRKAEIERFFRGAGEFREVKIRNS